jgi:hypothetical protein
LLPCAVHDRKSAKSLLPQSGLSRREPAANGKAAQPVAKLGVERQACNSTGSPEQLAQEMQVKNT